MSMKLRRQIPHEEFDYMALLNALSEYRYPRDRITTLLKNEVIIRVKKGLYVFGEDYRRGPFSREILANLAYGPSCISLDYALQHHGIIPEGVKTLTSVCAGRSREFQTPVGQFSYRQITVGALAAGCDQYETIDGRHFLMSVPEKALADKVRLDGRGIGTQKEMRAYLLENLRVEEEILRDLDLTRLEEYSAVYRSRKLRLLARTLSKLGAKKNLI